jgi:hypothetical protein
MQTGRTHDPSGGQFTGPRGARGIHRLHLPGEDLHRHLVLHHVVDAGAAATQAGARHFAKRQAGDGRQQLARRLAHALAVRQVAVYPSSLRVIPRIENIGSNANPCCFAVAAKRPQRLAMASVTGNMRPANHERTSISSQFCNAVRLRLGWKRRDALADFTNRHDAEKQAAFAGVSEERRYAGIGFFATEFLTVPRWAASSSGLGAYAPIPKPCPAACRDHYDSCGLHRVCRACKPGRTHVL